jgi:hypothetical protein
MLEGFMSVWPKLEPASPSLSGSEGALVSVSIAVEPRRLESLLEALAELPFPINPEIYHDAAIVTGQGKMEDITLVEFPAYAGRLEEVRVALYAHGFDPSSLQATNMLDEIQPEATPDSSGVPTRRLKRRPPTTVH